MGDNFNGFIRKICREYLSNNGFQPKDDPRLKELLESRDGIMKQELELMIDVKELLTNAAKTPKPVNYDDERKIVLAFLSKKHAKLDEIAKMTGVSKDNLIIILAALVDEKKIRLDVNWRYKLC